MMDRIDLSELLSWLLTHEQPVTEPELLKRFVPGSEDLMLAGVSAALYRVHFALYHHLYLLSRMLEHSHYHLHIRLIYVYLLRRPGPGSCGYLDETSCSFCPEPSEPGGALCSFHRMREERLCREKTVGIPGMAEFYLDESNCEAADEAELKKFEKEIYFYAAHYREIDSSLKLLDLPIDCSVERLRSRYRYLSKKYHPDLGGAPGPVPFSEITNAYTVLLRLKG